MKKTMITLAAMAALAAVLHADETITMTGGNAGRIVSVTTNANVITISPPARLVSISNAGGALVYSAVRVNATEFAAMLASTNAVPLPASSSFDFVGGDPIDEIVLQSATDTTNSVTIGVQR